MEEIMVIKGKFTHIRYRDDSSLFTVATFRLHDLNEKNITVTGIIPNIQLDLLVELTGHYIEHVRYGVQFEVVDCRIVVPNDEESLISYFASAQFSGIGKITAKKIVDELGLNAIDIIKENPDVLTTIFKKNDKRIKSVLEGIEKNDSLDETILFLNSLQLGVRNFVKVQVAYGDEASSIIKENPYRLMEDIDGIGFKTSDKIAKKLGFENYHPYRIKALLISCILETCIQRGDSYITIDDLLEKVISLSNKEGISFEDFHFEENMEILMRERFIVLEDDRVYHVTQYDAERGIAQCLKEFPQCRDYDRSISFLDTDIDMIQTSIGINYETKQRNAMHMFFEHPFSILTGGPGTGKTTIVKGILKLYQQYYPNDIVMLCAPTGRASKRLGECADAASSTIHRLLKWDLESNSFLINETQPLLVDCLIIDEFSMVDQWLFYNLLKACGNVKKILVIGDEDQLPSVGIGSVLHDLIESQQFPIVRLDKIYRQSEGSDVISLAYEIKQGTCDILETGKEIAFYECQPSYVKDTVMKLVSHALEKGYNQHEIQVLSPMYSGLSGIDQLNLSLQKMINPPALQKQIQVGYRIFREHDKVLQLKNLPDEDVYNGDIGEIVEIVEADEDFDHQNRIFVDFDGHLVEYTKENFNMLTHAYCISIHKSQGSEYPIVILPIVREHGRMLNLRLVYTAITRAKQSLVILGDKQAFLNAIQRKDTHLRKTTLTKRICE